METALPLAFSMAIEHVKNEILRCGFVPIIRTDNSAVAIRVAEAIRDGGTPLLEITMTVPGALDVLKHLSQSFKI
ncbi:MAG: hypothetical protein PVF53_12135 [Desulfobacterales bacterium]